MIRSRRIGGGALVSKMKKARHLNAITVLVLAFVMISSLILFNRPPSSPPDLHFDQDARSRLYMDGLLVPRSGEQCRSRIEHHFYRKKSDYKPSSYLLSRLREYEKRHRECAHEAATFARRLHSLSQKTPVTNSSSTTGCKFVVWIEYSGLGNRLVTLGAAFLYALTTNRVLLVDRGRNNHMSELLCEPFPGTSWLLPQDFPVDWLQKLDETSEYRFGTLVDRGRCIPNVEDIGSIHKLSYVHLTHTYNEQDRRFFCEAEQELLKQVPWMFMKTDLYFVPSLYFMPSFKTEMDRLFPDPETIFHHLGRYLLHPSNSVWGRTTRYFDAYLAGSDEVVGLQLRTFDGSEETQRKYSEEVVDCVLGKNILPNVTLDEGITIHRDLGKRRTVSVLVTSLHQSYYERLKEMYLRYPVQGYVSTVTVHLPSHEAVQKVDSAEHEKKALMEIFLLSLSDVLVTSPMSTFGYVAHGLAGIKPWILRRLDGKQVESSATCSRVLSLEPCFHAPPLYDCDCNGGRDPSKVLPVVNGCRDVLWGIQVVNP